MKFGTKAVTAIGATAVLAWGLSFLLMPLVQGREQGLDWFTSLCRAVGIYGEESASVRGIGSVSFVTWSPTVLNKVSQGDSKKGEALAAETCVACHDPSGSSADPATMPTIAGQPARAIYKQLWDIKNGTRINDIMKPLVDELNDDQIASLSAYYSRLKARNQDVFLEREQSASILKLVNEGDAARALPACRSCHDVAAGGPIEAPDLLGQYSGYTTAQLQAFASTVRRNDLFARMRSIAKKLTPEEIEGLAKHYEGPRWEGIHSYF